MLERIKQIKSVFFQKKMQAKNLVRNKKGIEIEMLGWWLIGLGVLVVMVIGTIILKGKGEGALIYIKNLFRFGR